MRKYYDILDEMIYDTFNNYILTNTIYEFINSFVRYYYLELVCVDNCHEKHAREHKAIKCIDTIHDIACFAFDSREFMLLCDVLNKINDYTYTDIVIDFDEYVNLEDSVYSVHSHKFMQDNRSNDSFYDYQYCLIRVDKYIEQYMIDEQTYIDLF